MATEPNADEWTVYMSPSDLPRVAKSIVTDPQVPMLIGYEVGKFLYMDCGLWAGSGVNHDPYRNFGVICGNWAAVCDFKEHDTCPLDTQLAAADAAGLKALLETIRGSDKRLELIKTMRYRGENERTTTRIEVFLPDLHIPLINKEHFNEQLRVVVDGKTHYRSDGPAMGRWNYHSLHGNDGAYFLNANTRVLFDEAEDWHRRYLKADIHEDASADLLIFLGRLREFADLFGYEVHLIQAGDMIDLWMGFDCFFEGTPENFPAVVLNSSGDEFVDHWVGRALAQGGDRQTVFEQLASWPADRRHFLYGNHDNYLARRAGGLPKRKTNYWYDHLFAEHGHAGDSFNRDGERAWFLEGHWITNKVFESPGIRDAESYFNDPRKKGLEWAVRQYLDYSKAINVYVQGHSHTIGLGMVKVVYGSLDIIGLQAQSQLGY